MIPTVPAPQSLWSRFATFLATGFGSGYSPFAPGTAGSLVGLVLLLPLREAGLVWELAFLVLFTVGGIWAGGVVARRLGIEDPGIVVVDEIVGMWITLLFLPLKGSTAAAGFVLFRVMDVWKPYPARQLEHLPGGLGIMADDVMAGIYANLCLRIGLRLLSP
jgi:phosphatidylglycerophosphatase A